MRSDVKLLAIVIALIFVLGAVQYCRAQDNSYTQAEYDSLWESIIQWSSQVIDGKQLGYHPWGYVVWRKYIPPGVRISDINPNMLMINGVTKYVFTECPNYKYRKGARVWNFDLRWFAQADSFGINGGWSNLADCQEEVKWSYLKNIGSNKAYWKKVRLIAKTAYEHNQMFIFFYTSYSTFGTNPKKSAWNKNCIKCDGAGGPLVDGAGFFDYKSSNSTIKEVMAVQNVLMDSLAACTGAYPNIVYCPMWETSARLVQQQRGWREWHKRWLLEMVTRVSRHHPGVNHLYCLEYAPIDMADWKDLGYDFIIDEDGNGNMSRPKLDGVPLVYISTDGVWSGRIVGWPYDPLWNKCDRNQETEECDCLICEPAKHIEFMRWVIETQGAAGTAPVWVAGRDERPELLRLSKEFNK